VRYISDVINGTRTFCSRWTFALIANLIKKNQYRGVKENICKTFSLLEVKSEDKAVSVLN
jgi:hypothetical protein